MTDEQAPLGALDATHPSDGGLEKTADSGKATERTWGGPSAGAELAIGTRLGSRYVIQALLGRGAMGTVYRALDEVLGEPVALKFVAGDPRGLGILRDEVRLAQRVTHPNVCRTFDLVEADGLAFVKMEFVEGESLAEHLKRQGKLPSAEAVRLARQILHALGAAHAREVVHRDLKPANVLIEKTTGRVVVMDFGIARAASTGTAGEIAGTPSTMSPEQVRGGVIDGRSDLYALGCVLYELLVGAPPFAGQGAAEVMKQHVLSPVPDPRKQRAELPPALAAVVMRLMAKAPAERFPTAIEAERALAGRARGSWPAIVAALLTMGAVAAGVTLKLQPGPGWQPRVQAHLPVFDENSDGAVFSPDGKWIAYGSDREVTGDFRIYLAPAAGGPGRPLTVASQNLGLVRFAPDGASLLAWAPAHDGLYRLKLPGGESSRIDEGGDFADQCGDRIAVQSRIKEGCAGCTAIELHDADGTVHPLLRSEAERAFFWLRCDRAGRQLAYAEGPRGSFLGAATDIWLLALDASGNPEGAPRNLTHHPEFDNLWPAFTADGTSVVFSSTRSGTTNLWEVSTLGGDPVQRTFRDGPDVEADLSADGKQLLWTVDQTSLPIFARTLEGGATRRLTAELETFEQVIVPPDGKELFGVATRRGKQLILGVALDNGAERVITEGKWLAISNDARTLFYAGAGAEQQRVWSIPVGGGKATLLATFPGPVSSLSAGATDLHVSVSGAAGREPWRIPLGGGASEREAAAPWCVVREAPSGGWRLLIDCNRNGKHARLIAPGASLDGPGPEVTALDFRWVGPDSFIYTTDRRKLMRHTVDGRDEGVVELPLILDAALSADAKTLYYVVPSAHVRRQLVTNWAERPLPWRK